MLPATLSHKLDTLDHSLQQMEQRSLLLTAILLTLGLLVLGTLYVCPSSEPISHGIYYAELSKTPLSAADNPNAYRILTPLIAYLVGLRGNAIVFVNVAFAWVLLAWVYVHYRKSDASPSLALVKTCMLAFTTPTLFTLNANGYTDSATYLFVFLMFIYVDNVWAFGGLLFLGMLNREAIIFLVPFFLILRRPKEPRTLAAYVISVVIAGLAYMAIRYAISEHASVKHSFSFYLSPISHDPLYWIRSISRTYGVGFFSAFKLLWFVPLAACVYCIQERRYYQLLLLVSPIVCAMAQSLVAVDTSRMLSMAFPTLLVGMDTLIPALTEKRARDGVALLVILNFLVPQLYVAGDSIYVLRTLLGSLLFPNQA